MAKKQPGNEEANSGVVFDQRTKTVMANYHIATDNVKAKITKVRECVPNNVKKDDIAIVLDYFEQDMSKTIEAFNAGNTESILQTWFVSGKKGGKGTQAGKNKRKRNRQGNQNANNSENDAIKADSIVHPPSSTQPAVSTDLSSKETTSSAKDTAVRLPQPKDNNNNNNKTSQPNLNHNPTERGKSSWNQRRRDQSPRQGPQSSRQGERPQGDGRNRRTTQGRNRVEQGNPNVQNNSRRKDVSREGEEVPTSKDGRTDKGGNQERRDVRESTSSESSIPGKKKQGANFERLEKDLHRTIVSLTRCKSLLSTQLDDSEKRIKKSFQEVRQQLQERELALLNNFNDIKRQSESLIDNRQQTAADLKMKIAKANSLSEQEVLELRASVKHFVSDRKTDEEIAQTMRFTYTPDQLIAEVKKYGDVNMEISRYSSRRPSMSSLGTISRTTSVCEDIPQTLSRGVSVSESTKSPDGPKSPERDLGAEADHFAAKIKQKFKSPDGPKSPERDLSAEADHFAAKIQQKFQARRGGQSRRGSRNQSGGRGGQDGGGRRRENSGSQDQGRRPQNNQEGSTRRQNSSSRDGNNRKRTNSGSAEKNNDKPKVGNRENQRPPRREVGGGGNRGQQARGPKREENTDQPEGKAAEGGDSHQPESPRKQRNFTRRQQHRKRQGNDGRQGNDTPQGGNPIKEEGNDGSPKKDGVEAGETQGSAAKHQENGPRITENGPKSSEKPITVVKNGPTGEAKMTPPSIEINAGDSESGTSIGSTPVSSPGMSGDSSEKARPAEKEGIPNGLLTNGKASEEDEEHSIKGNKDEGYHGESPNDSTASKKIIEREKVESTGKESAMMVNGDTEVDGDVAGQEEAEDDNVEK